MFYLIGSPLGHSISPFIHRELARKKGIDIQYDLLETDVTKLEATVELLRSSDGFNVTIPHKTNIIPYLFHVDGVAGQIGAVNTVQCAGGKMYGFNTDAPGFLKALNIAGMSLSGDVLLCGTGGVSLMMAYESLSNGCSVTVASRNRNSEKARAFAAHLKSIFGSRSQIHTCGYDEIDGRYDILLNGTPCGMFPRCDEMPVPESVVLNCRQVFDTIYNPLRTRLCRFASENNIPACNGLSMLVNQAASAQEIWFDTVFTDGELMSVYKSAENYLKISL